MILIFGLFVFVIGLGIGIVLGAAAQKGSF